MAAPVPFPPPTRWSHTLVHTLLACAASLALHALALGGLAWLYHRSAALAPPPAEVHIASVYLVPVAPRLQTRPEAAPPTLPTPEKALEETVPAAVAKAVEPEPAAPRPAAAARPERISGVDVAAPVGTRRDPLPRTGDGAKPDTRPAVPASATEGVAPPVALPPPPRAGEGREAVPSRDARTHAGIEWRVQDWLAQHRQYPRAARRSGAEGTVWVRFVLDRRGGLQGSEILESSGHAVLDRAALDLLQRAAPFPALPPELTTDEIELVLPIEYDLTRARRG